MLRILDDCFFKFSIRNAKQQVTVTALVADAEKKIKHLEEQLVALKAEKPIEDVSVCRAQSK